MNFDFALVLVLATLVTGLGWLVDRVFFQPKRIQQQANVPAELDEDARQSLLAPPWWAEMSRSMFPVLALVLIVRSFLVEPFQIPSGSMLPTLKIGDFILVNKFHYGLRLPVLNQKIVAINEPERGDVVVFKYPNDPTVNYIKRVVGLPGDIVRYQDKQLFVNDQLQPQQLVAKLPPRQPQVLLYNESLGEIQHQIYTDLQRPVRDGQWTVPPGHYFVMGDNRDNSNDSRYWGFVPDNLLMGKAVAVWMHWPTLFSVPEFSSVRTIE